MRYDISKLPIADFLRPVTDATAALCRLDERIAQSSIGKGWLSRMHFADACASMWVDGELVHVEDLVLHDAGTDIRAPTHELTIASDVLRTRRRMADQSANWALSGEGIRWLRGQGHNGIAGDLTVEQTDSQTVTAKRLAGSERDDKAEEEQDPLSGELAELDAALARTDALLSGSALSAAGQERDSLIYDPDWDEEARLIEWRAVFVETQDMPPILRAALLLDAWNRLEVFQHARWLGRLLSAASLRDCKMTTNGHLAAFNLGLKSIAVDQRRSWNREKRLLAFVQAISLAAESGLKEHDRLNLARQTMERRLLGRRRSSRLPELIDLVLSHPMVSTGMVAKALGITPRAALRIIEELNLRELTGRGRFRAWGVV